MCIIPALSPQIPGAWQLPSSLVELRFMWNRLGGTVRSALHGPAIVIRGRCSRSAELCAPRLLFGLCTAPCLCLEKFAFCFMVACSPGPCCLAHADPCRLETAKQPPRCGPGQQCSGGPGECRPCHSFGSAGLVLLEAPLPELSSLQPTTPALQPHASESCPCQRAGRRPALRNLRLAASAG